MDEPIVTLPKVVRDAETRAIAAYRAKYPDGPPWQELHLDTRAMWLRAIEEAQR